jgi:hypothetical protein
MSLCGFYVSHIGDTGSVPEGLEVGRSLFFVDSASVHPTFDQVGEVIQPEHKQAHLHDPNFLYVSTRSHHSQVLMHEFSGLAKSYFAFQQSICAKARCVCTGSALFSALA